MRTMRRTLGRHRRLIAAALAALAITCALAALTPGPPPTTTILTATRDLKPGPLKPSDLTMRPFPPDAVPDGALRDKTNANGRILATPVRRGEPITDVRLLGPDLLIAHGTDTVATPVRITDAEAAALLSPGDVIDVLSTPTGWEETSHTGTPAQTVAGAVPVLTTRPHTSQTGALIVLATTPYQATRLATAQASGPISIAIRPRRQ